MLRRQLTRKQLLPFSGAAGAMPGGDGSLRGCTLLAPGDRPTRSHRAADEPALRQAVAQEPEERRQRCRGHLQGGRAALDAVRASQERASAGRASTPSYSFPAIKWRTALANEIRGLLGEYGIVVAKGIAPLRRELPRLLDDEGTQLSGLFREMLGEMAERLKYLDRRIDEYDLKVVRVFGQDERCQRLAKVEGVGPLTATALVAAVGNAH